MPSKKEVNEQLVQDQGQLDRAAEDREMGSEYLYGNGRFPQDKEEGLRLIQQAADAGDPIAKIWLDNAESDRILGLECFHGSFYGGIGFYQDKKKGLKLIQNAADLGDPQAKRFIEKYDSNYFNQFTGALINFASKIPVFLSALISGFSSFFSSSVNKTEENNSLDTTESVSQSGLFSTEQEESYNETEVLTSGNHEFS